MDICSISVDQVREPPERHNVDIAALKENKRVFDLTPEFLAHLTFNHCGDSIMQLMGRHPELYNLSLGTCDSIVGLGKQCLGCMIASLPQLALPQLASEHLPEDVVKSPPYGPAMLFACDATQSTPNVAASVVAKTCERLLSQWEPCLGPIWGLDATHPPATDAHEGTEECIRTVHRDRCAFDCVDTGLDIDLNLQGAPRQLWDPSVSPGATEGSHSDHPTESPSEPASPPHSDTLWAVLTLREGWGLLRTLVCQRGWGS